MNNETTLRAALERILGPATVVDNDDPSWRRVGVVDGVLRILTEDDGWLTLGLYRTYGFRRGQYSVEGGPDDSIDGGDWDTAAILAAYLSDDGTPQFA